MTIVLKQWLKQAVAILERWRMIPGIKENLDSIKDSYQVFYFALLAAGLMHIVFLLFFFFLGIHILVAFNLFSCFVYYLCARAFLNVADAEDYRLIAIIAMAEVIAHAYLASYFVGLNSGFHYYIFILTVVPIIKASITLYANLIRLIVIVFAYIILLWWLGGALPIYQLDQTLLTILCSLNVAAVLLGVGIISLKILYVVLKEKAMLSSLATTDKLTGLYNRHGFMAIVAQEVDAREQRTEALSILVLDVDLFKEVNDQYGHQCGDYVLSKLAKVMRAVLRKHEMIARWGGDEFIVLLPDTDTIELAALAERLRLEVAETVFNFKNNHISISVSIGGTTYQPGDSFESLASRADRALYKGKHAGRNAFNMILV